jgi:Protein of unknown function VcgC/VcgE (DUF2780)
MEVAMTRQGCLGCISAALIVGFAALPAAKASAQTAPAASAEAIAAAKASPDLVGSLSKELSASPEQAAGAAGALFGLAKTRLKPEEFSQVSKAVPGMDSLLKAAPAMAAVGTSGAAGQLSKMGGSASGLASAAQAFSKLGLSPDMVAKAIPVLTQFVSKSGGANVGKLLAGVLK